jgi:hypothetical protein
MLSALPPIATDERTSQNSRFVPIGDVRLPMRMPVAYQGFIPIE